MTDEQFAELILYLDTSNQIMNRISDYQMLIFFVLSLFAGIVIGGKIGK